MEDKTENTDVDAVVEPTSPIRFDSIVYLLTFIFSVISSVLLSFLEIYLVLSSVVFAWCFPAFFLAYRKTISCHGIMPRILCKKYFFRFLIHASIFWVLSSACLSLLYSMEMFLSDQYIYKIEATMLVIGWISMIFIATALIDLL